MKRSVIVILFIIAILAVVVFFGRTTIQNKFFPAKVSSEQSTMAATKDVAVSADDQATAAKAASQAEEQVKSTVDSAKDAVTPTSSDDAQGSTDINLPGDSK